MTFKDYWDYEETIKHFLKCSVLGEMDNFDFEQAFESFKGEIERKLAEHGLLSCEEFKKLHEDINDYSCLGGLTVNTNYINISEDDLKEYILEGMYKKYKETFEDYSSFDELKEILNQIDNIDLNNRSECVFLFDKVIHAQHETGDIYDVDIQSIKDELDEELKEVV